MQKTVFRPSEVLALKNKVDIESPALYKGFSHLAPAAEKPETLNDIEEYKGPTADDLRREAEAFKIHWEAEKERMISNAKNEAQNIIQDARDLTAKEIEENEISIQTIKQQADEEAEKIINDAKAKANEIENETRKNLDNERNEAKDEGRKAGREEGYNDGKDEVERLINRTQAVLEKAQNKRSQLLAEYEQQIIDLVLLISRKIIKIISESQRNIIIANVVQALRKIKSKGDVIIRVNMSDLQLATEHKEEFIKLMEGVKSIHVVEDTSVDPGGCIIETDFGEIDARISSQLFELESKILELSPIKSKMKNSVAQNIASSVNPLDDQSASLLEASHANENENMDISKPDKDDDQSEDQDDIDNNSIANTALTASAALAALATMSIKGKRQSDKELLAGLRKSDKS